MWARLKEKAKQAVAPQEEKQNTNTTTSDSVQSSTDAPSASTDASSPIVEGGADAPGAGASAPRGLPNLKVNLDTAELKQAALNLLERDVETLKSLGKETKEILGKTQEAAGKKLGGGSASGEGYGGQKVTKSKLKIAVPQTAIDAAAAALPLKTTAGLSLLRFQQARLSAMTQRRAELAVAAENVDRMFLDTLRRLAALADGSRPLRVMLFGGQQRTTNITTTTTLPVAGAGLRASTEEAPATTEGGEKDNDSGATATPPRREPLNLRESNSSLSSSSTGMPALPGSAPQSVSLVEDVLARVRRTSETVQVLCLQAQRLDEMLGQAEADADHLTMAARKAMRFSQARRAEQERAEAVRQAELDALEKSRTVQEQAFELERLRLQAATKEAELQKAREERAVVEARERMDQDFQRQLAAYKEGQLQPKPKQGARRGGVGRGARGQHAQKRGVGRGRGRGKPKSAAASSPVSANAAAPPAATDDIDDLFAEAMGGDFLGDSGGAANSTTSQPAAPRSVPVVAAVQDEPDEIEAPAKAKAVAGASPALLSRSLGLGPPDDSADDTMAAPAEDESDAREPAGATQDDDDEAFESASDGEDVGDDWM